jgi:hypothetical protein
VLRDTGLKNDKALAFSSSGASGYLGKKLKCAFRCTKVRHVKPYVAVNDTYEGNIRQIVSFGDHLSTHENVGFFLPNVAEHFGVVFE